MGSEHFYRLRIAKKWAEIDSKTDEVTLAECGL
jgi:hypothetical protein